MEGGTCDNVYNIFLNGSYSDKIASPYSAVCSESRHRTPAIMIKAEFSTFAKEAPLLVIETGVTSLHQETFDGN